MSTPSRRNRVVFFIGAAGALSLAWIAVWRYKDAPEATTPASIQAAVIPLEHRASELKFDLDPGKVGVASVVDAIEKRVTTAGADLVSADRAHQLAAVVGKRFQLFLLPDFEAWVEEASRYGVVPDAGPSQFDQRPLRDRWMACARGMKMAPVATGGIRVRRIAPDSKPTLITDSPGSFIRAAKTIASASYPKPDPGLSGVLAVEVLVPIKYRSAGATESDQPGTSVMRLYWTPALNEWRPYDFMVYFDGSASGKSFPMPAF